MTIKKTPIVVNNDDWKNLIGIQFALGGNNPQNGLNCYGLVREIYKGLQIELPEHQETALDAVTLQNSAGNDWKRIDEPVPYCVVLIRSEGNVSAFHLGVITPELTMLHAMPKMGVVVSPIDQYAKRIIGFYWYTPGEGERLPIADGDVGRIIGMVAVVALSIAVPAIAGTGFFGYSSLAVAVAQGGVAGAIASAAVLTAGTMILNAIAPMKPDMPQLSGYGGDLADSRSYTFDGIVNEARQGLSKAMLFGRCRVGGQIISEKTWFDGDNNEYLDMLLCPTVGTITRFEDLQINDSSIQLYKNTAAVFRPGDDQQTVIEMFDKIYLQYSSAAKIPYDASLTSPTNVLQFTTKDAIDGIRITLSAQNGLYELSGNTPTVRDVDFRIQYKKTTDVSWSDLQAVEVDDTVTHPLIYRSTGVFTGTENPYTLTDAPALFDTKIDAGGAFELTVGVVQYYCTQVSTLSSSVLTFDAFTDAGRTTPLGTKPDDGLYLITDDKSQLNIADMNINLNYNTWSPAVIVPELGFETVDLVEAIKFRLTVTDTVTTYAKISIYYQPFSGGDALLHQVVDLGTPPVVEFDENGNPTYTYSNGQPFQVAFIDVEINGIAADQYRVGILVSKSDSTLTADNFDISNLVLDATSVPGYFNIAGAAKNPMHLVSKAVESISFDEDNYDFRIWRITEDSTSISVIDDVYLRGYAEIINRALSYPGHALVGLRAMATDRLYGGRPTVTALATGAPLTVPSASLRHDAMVVTDYGVVSDYALVNGLVVTGMRKILIDAELVTPDNTYYWLVRMDSSGFADTGHLLTKHFIRIQTWEIIGTQTYCYIQDNEEIPAATSVMVFNENAEPYISRRTAFAVAKMLIYGSHGHITENSIDWTAFAAWDAWNMVVMESTGEPRHLYDAIVDFNTDLWSLAMKASQTARGNLYKKGIMYSVWVDKAATPRQVFGEGNNNKTSFNPIPRSDRANIVTASYLDQTKQYDQIDISEEDVQGSEYPIVKALPVQVGVTRLSQIESMLQYNLLQNRHVKAIVSTDTGIDSLGTSIGDVFIQASQAKDFSISGRVRQCNVAGELEIDQPFTPEVGVQYELTVWGTDNAIYTWQGTLSGSNITAFVRPTGLPDSDYYDYPYVLAKVTQERMKYRCIGVKRSAETMNAALVGIEYRDEVYIND